MTLRQTEDDAIIASYLAGRSVRSIACEYERSERSVKIAIRRNPYARAELNRTIC